MKTVLRVALVFCLLGMVFACGQVAPTKVLSWKYKKGDVQKLNIESFSVIEETMSGMSMVLTQEATIGYTYEVKDITKDGNFLISVVYRMFKTKTSSSMSAATSYDSENPGDSQSPESGIYKALLGKGFTMEMAQNGKIIKMTGISEMMSNMVKGMGALDEATQSQMLSTLSTQFGR